MARTKNRKKRKDLPIQYLPFTSWRLLPVNGNPVITVSISHTSSQIITFTTETYTGRYTWMRRSRKSCRTFVKNTSTASTDQPSAFVKIVVVIPWATSSRFVISMAPSSLLSLPRGHGLTGSAYRFSWMLTKPADAIHCLRLSAAKGSLPMRRTP